MTIRRTLIHKGPEGKQTTIVQDDIASFTEPVVILGDPGLGKTVLTQALGELQGVHYFRAGTFVRQINLASSIAEDKRVVIDGLDEIASGARGGAVEAVLRKLSELGNPPFILSCRAADWLGAAGRIRIEHDYGAAPIVLHLQPFTRNDALAFLSGKFPESCADRLLDSLEQRGLDGLYGNPLTLRMLGEVARTDGRLPENRVELIDRACRVMLRERNDYHDADFHACCSADELLLAAGAICAAQVLCDRSGVQTGSREHNSEDRLRIADISKLCFGDAADNALKVRLFQAESENRFTYIHRMIAEYLGAKWLARCFEDGVSETRIFGLFRQGEGVPTSLRGLHAWMAHFSSALAHRCIEADPYAVLRYGDAETLDLDRARALLAALKDLSEEDPYFRSEDWGRHPASGLMRVDLRDEVLDIIGTSESHAQLTALLLEAMTGTPLAKALVPTLKTIMFDEQRIVGQRSMAMKALYAADVCHDWRPVIHRLVEMNDPGSTRVAFEILRRLGLCSVPDATSIRAVLAYFGLTSTQDPENEHREFRYVPDSLFNDLDAGRLASWLDDLVEIARPLMPNADSWANSYVTGLVRSVALQVLEGDPSIQAERVWQWIGWLDGHHGQNNDASERLAKIFRENHALRAAVIEHVLLTPCAKNTWMASLRLSDTSLELHPTAEDVASILKTPRTWTGDDSIGPDTWRDLLQIGRTANGLPDEVRNAAIEAANDDPELLSALDKMSEPMTQEWETRWAEQDAKNEALRQAAFRYHRQILAERAEAVTAGDVHVLRLPAEVYLDRGYALGEHHEFGSDMSPEGRLYEFLGDDLAEQTMSGFLAVLERGDLPGASEIAKARCDNNHFVAEASMICGIAEMLRRGRALNEIPQVTIAAAYMAWERAPEANAVGSVDIGPALEAALFHCDSDWENHFRTSIEPQLDHDPEHIDGLYRLAHDRGLSRLAGRLAVEWLSSHPSLRLSTQVQLLACALDGASPEQQRKLIVGNKTRNDPDDETKFLWLSAEYVVDFDSCREALEQAANDNPAFLWFIRSRVGSDSLRSDRLSLDQLTFIITAFGEHWPRTAPPHGVYWGDRNPWDACEFIRRTIYMIANRPSAEATQTLQDLISNHAPSYVDILKHALALQLRARRDAEYTAPTIQELQAVVANGLPKTIDDMRDWFRDRIEDLQKRIRASDTDMWEAYWKGDKPTDENYCRNRLIEHMSIHLPKSIRFEPETHMPLGKKADIALTRNAIKLPVEIKGQWHSKVWNAASDQLDAKYAIDRQAEGRGVYIVLWFGDIPQKQLPGHPDGLERPGFPEELQRMLIDRLPEARRAWIDIYVLDVSKPSRVP